MLYGMCSQLTAALVTTSIDSFDNSAFGSPQLFMIVRIFVWGNNRSSAFSTIFFWILKRRKYRDENKSGNNCEATHTRARKRWTVICLLRLGDGSLTLAVHHFALIFVRLEYLTIWPNDSTGNILRKCRTHSCDENGSLFCLSFSCVYRLTRVYLLRHFIMRRRKT